MDIRCERCRTEYEFDEARLTEAGITVKCTTCGHVFKVKKPGPVGVVAPPAVIAIRRAGQVIVPNCPDFATLQRWIVERRIIATDEIQQGLGPWHTVAGTPELAPFLDVVERASNPSIPPVPADIARTAQMLAPGYGAMPSDPNLAAAQVASTMQFRAPGLAMPAPQAQPQPDPYTASTQQFRAPGLAMPAPQPEAFAAPQAATMQFRALTNPAQAPAPQPDPYAPAPATMQFRPPPQAAPPADAWGVPQAASLQFQAPPPGALPTAIAAPPPAATMQFRAPVPQAAPPPDDASTAATMQMRIPEHLVGVVPGAQPNLTQDAISTMQFRVPTEPRTAPVTATMPAPGQEAPTGVQFRAAASQPAAQPVAPSPAVVSVPAPIRTAGVATTEFRAPESIAERPLPHPEPGRRDDTPPRSPAGDDSTDPRSHKAPSDGEDVGAPRKGARPASSNKSPGGRSSEPAWTRGDSVDEEEDPEILALRNRGRSSRLVLGIIAVVLAIGAVGALVVWPRLQARGPVPPEAQAAFDKARTAYLTHALAEFPAAEQGLEEAIKKADPVQFTQARASLAELHNAWAERLLDEAAVSARAAETLGNTGDSAGSQAATKRMEAARGDAKKHLDKAFEEAKLALAQDEESLGANRALVDYYRTAKDPQAEVYLKRIEKPAQQDAETRAHLAAYWALDAKQAGAAEIALKEVTKQLPAFVRARFWLAQIYLAKDNAEGVREQFEAILATSPSHERAKAFVGELKAAEEKARKDAEAAAQAATDAGMPADAGTPSDTAAAEPAKTEPAKTEPAKTEPAKTEPAKTEPAKAGDPDKLINQAVAALDKGKAAKALDLYDQALAIKPKNTDALYGKGLALFDLERTDESIAAFQEVLGVSPKFVDAMIGLAEAYKQKKQNREAVKWYQRYLELAPDGDQAGVAKTNIERLK